MGKSKIGQKVALFSLFITVTCPVLAFDLTNLVDGSISVSVKGCSYGRGKLAIATAKAEAAKQLSESLISNDLFSAVKKINSINSQSINEKSIELLANAISHHRVSLSFSEPELVGDETCVTTSIPLGVKNQYKNDVKFDSNKNETKSVVVTGIGHANNKMGLTARQAAEQDAFSRAISQVLGVVIKSGFSSIQHSNMHSTETSDKFEVIDMYRNSLSMTSHGNVRRWNEISNKILNNGSIEVTLKVEVEMLQLASLLKQEMDKIGSPAIFVVSENKHIAKQLNRFLLEMGLIATAEPDSASLLLIAKVNKKTTNRSARLDMQIYFEDRFANQYGIWRNDPSFLSLPDSKEVLTQLADVYFQVKANQKAIKETIQAASLALVSAGGPVYEIMIAEHIAGKHHSLNGIFTGLADVSDVKISKQVNKTRVQFRSISRISDLSHLLAPAFKIHSAGRPHKFIIKNDFQLAIL